ncbi:O-methyltransferase [Aspergillus avenaceus]|uniref:O-methyltransferase n=1 Tax=Aspergillus avenaceus TaxID=36643 RepID=A0A5N6U0T3_ASPAV|nr:O-methyltransferase [Aspergillus avenaceus]
MVAESAKSASQPVDLSLAARPNNIEAVPNLLREITKDVDNLATGTEEDRKSVAVKCRDLALALETLRETMTNHCWGQMGIIAAIGFGVDSGLWALMARNGDNPQKVTDLSSSLGMDSKLLSRMMRHVSAMGLLVETGEDGYQPTNYTKALSLPQIGHGYLGVTACTGAAALKFHEYSRKRGWMNPTDSQDTPLMYAYGTDKTVFHWVQDCGYGKHLNDYLSAYKLGRPIWADPSVYPVKERLIDGADASPDAPFLVDIGGNVGYDLERFHGRFPNAPGRLILQDLPMMIHQIKSLDPAIVRMEYDFHTEQPVKGARAYFIHSILHNWPDDVCESILAQAKKAMKPGYSRLLLNENVVPDTGAHWETTGLDMIMLALFSSEERTRTAWYDLIERKSGLKIVKIWSAGKGVESLIEVEKIA